MEGRDRAKLHQPHSHSVLLLHVVWATCRRAAVLPPACDPWLAQLLGRKAVELGCALLGSGNASDHVHAVLRFPATLCVADLVRRLKGASSYAWNSEGPGVTSPLRWQTGYWAESVSPSQVLSLLRYVERQRRHHGETTTIEPWEAEAVLVQDDGSPKGFPDARTGRA